jgi:hypothetical protein
MTGAPAWHLAWSQGGHARIAELVGERIVLVSTVPLPPGSRAEGALEGEGTLRVKSHGSRKQEDGTFRVEGRVLDLRRELRERLAKLAAGEVTS